MELLAWLKSLVACWMKKQEERVLLIRRHLLWSLGGEVEVESDMTETQVVTNQEKNLAQTKTLREPHKNLVFLYLLISCTFIFFHRFTLVGNCYFSQQVGNQVLKFSHVSQSITYIYIYIHYTHTLQTLTTEELRVCFNVVLWKCWRKCLPVNFAVVGIEFFSFWDYENCICSKIWKRRTIQCTSNPSRALQVWFLNFDRWYFDLSLLNETKLASKLWNHSPRPFLLIIKKIHYEELLINIISLIN